MAPMLMRLLGAPAPKTVEGTIAGKPEATAAAPSPFAAFVTNARRDCSLLCISHDLAALPLRRKPAAVGEFAHTRLSREARDRGRAD